uniref:Uncharacterized protein n=1 Tax=Anguilla anguilla TaxID=7936 RepID=A0A0E9QW31_ANGAN
MHTHTSAYQSHTVTPQPPTPNKQANIIPLQSSPIVFSI